MTDTTVYGNSVFVPAATEWVRDSSISVANLVGEPGVQFVFISQSNHGNGLYLDNVNVGFEFVHTGVQDVASQMKISVVPNPATDHCTVFIDLEQAAATEVMVYDMLGQKVVSSDLGMIRSASQSVSLAGLTAGVYVIKVKAGEKVYTKRLVKQ